MQVVGVMRTGDGRLIMLMAAVARFRVSLFHFLVRFSFASIRFW